MRSGMWRRQSQMAHTTTGTKAIVLTAKYLPAVRQPPQARMAMLPKVRARSVISW